MTAPILPGCEPLTVDGSATGVLVLHGFTGSPVSVRPLAERFANAGFCVEMPLLPGHGTSVEDMMTTSFADWAAGAEAAYATLAARTEQVVVTGLSMGGLLTCWLAERHPEIAGIIVVNPLVEPPGAELTQGLSELLAAGVDRLDSIGSDIAKSGANESAYPATPVACLVSLFEGVDQVSAELGSISCPALLFSSRDDHVVPPTNGAHLLASVSGPIEQVILERSFHVATLDHDAPLIEAEAVAFVERLAS